MPVRWLVSLIFVNGTLVLIYSHLPIFWLVALLFVLGGIPITGYQAGVSTVLQSVSDAFRGRIFGAQYSTRTFLVIVGQLLAGLLVGQAGSQVLLSVNGSLLLFAGLLGWWFLRRYVSSAASLP